MFMAFADGASSVGWNFGMPRTADMVGTLGATFKVCANKFVDLLLFDTAAKVDQARQLGPVWIVMNRTH